MYYILEMQTNQDGTSAHIIQKNADINQAESIFHNTLAYAATSSIYCHSVVIISSDGDLVKSECYWHVPEEEEEPEEEPEQQ